MQEFTTIVLLSVAAFTAGGLNAIAGGGTFITLPSLIFAGLPPIIANATSAAVVLPGYGSSALGYRALLSEIHLKDWAILLTTTIVGAIVGAQLLVSTSDEVFGFLAPVLVLFATCLFAMSSRLKNLLVNDKSQQPWLSSTGVGLTSAYGGYFNGGLGIALLAVLQLYRSNGKTLSLNTTNGIKSAISFVLTSVSVLVFGLSGVIQWRVAVPMMIFSIAGGYFGARLSLNVAERYIRCFVITLGVAMSAVLSLRFFSHNN